MKKVLWRPPMKGNDALAEAAIQAGLTHYFGYPITPQTEILEYLSEHLPEHGGTFIQAESEESSIFMAMGASAAGGRPMTSSSGPGISRMQEGISFLACAELPCVIVDMMRAGPGLGGVNPSQQDYFQIVKGGGHGDSHNIVLTPASVQELVDLTILAFDLADQYRNPVFILGDGMLGQMMETVEFPKTPNRKRRLPKKEWAVGLRKNRPPNLVVPFDLNAPRFEQKILAMYRKHEQIKETECRSQLILPVEWEPSRPELDLILVGYGTTARILKTVRKNVEKGLRVGLIRPITVWPFPEKTMSEFAEYAKDFLVVEMSMGQMVDDVKIAVNGKTPVHFYGRTGGVVPGPAEILEKVGEITRGRRK